MSDENKPEATTDDTEHRAREGRRVEVQLVRAVVEFMRVNASLGSFAAELHDGTKVRITRKGQSRSRRRGAS